MPVTLYQSTDTSAPILTGTVGSLVALLDAVLVNGYGTKAGSGWSIIYTATNKRQYQMGSGGTGFQLFIDDTGPGTHGGREARMTGFKAGTAIGAGTGQFPSLAQQAIGIGALVIRKSFSADGTARAWTVIADEHTFYLFIDTKDFTSGVAGAVLCTGTAFGDFTSYIPEDAGNCIIIGRTKEANQYYGSNFGGNYQWSNTFSAESFNQLNANSQTIMTDVNPGHYVASGYNGIGTSIPVGKTSDTAKMGGSYINSSQMGYLGGGQGPQGDTVITWPSAFSYPNMADQGLYTAPVWLNHNSSLRGHLRGIWNPLQMTPLAHGDTYAGAGNMASKELIAISLSGIIARQMNQAAHNGPTQVHVEYTDTWS